MKKSSIPPVDLKVILDQPLGVELFGSYISSDKAFELNKNMPANLLLP